LLRPLPPAALNRYVVVSDAFVICTAGPLPWFDGGAQTICRTNPVTPQNHQTLQLARRPWSSGGYIVRAPVCGTGVKRQHPENYF
jgi:hypothetical protein